MTQTESLNISAVKTNISRPNSLVLDNLRHQINLIECGKKIKNRLSYVSREAVPM